MPAGNHNRTPWVQEPDFASHQLLSVNRVEEPSLETFADCLDEVMACDPEIDAYMGYPELQQELAVRKAQDMHHEHLLEELRRQRHLGVEAGKVFVLRSAVNLTETTSSHSLSLVDRRQSLGN